MLDVTRTAGPGGDEPPSTYGWPDDPPGYELAEQVGRGGMGVVYRARDRAMNRQVAVKILLERFGHDSSTARRFVAEAQITGQLQHPAIPAVYHVGRLPDGRPFLAMKLIKGRTLDTLLRTCQPLNAPAVFEAIAQAIGYAHAHGVIHRDLKPGNVMVGSFGEVQVMDWGLAKILDGGPATTDPAGSADPELTETLTAILGPPDSDGRLTVAGSVLGTPAYMAPEQAAGEVAKVDRRSDVFGLGAILCALLTGEPPFSGRDAESVRLASVRGKTEVAFARLDACQAEPDVVALCKRCLSFEPADRPADASAVAREIAGLRAAADDRARQAELARARAEVQAQEQRKRRRVMQAAAAGVAGVLLLGIAGTALGLVRAQGARRAAESSLADTKAVLAFVEDRVFSAARPEGHAGGLGRDVTLKRAIESAAPSVAGSFRDQPLIEARLRNTLGTSFLFLGEPEAARAMYQRARELYTAELGPIHPDTLSSIQNLANSDAALGRHVEALALREETLRLTRARYGPDHPQTLSGMHNLANSYAALGRHAEALTLREVTLRHRKAKLGLDHPDTLLSINNLAATYGELGRFPEANALRAEAFEGYQATLGPNHLYTISSMQGLALSLYVLGRHSEALALREKGLQRRRALLGPDHPDTLMSMQSAADSFAVLGRQLDALALREEAFKKSRATLGPDHPDTLGAMQGLANSYAALGRQPEALALREETLQRRRATLGPDHPHTLLSMQGLAVSYCVIGRHAESLELHEKALELSRTLLGPDHPDTLLNMHNMASSYAALDRYAEAADLLESTVERRKAKLGPGHPDTLSSMHNLADCCSAVGRHAESLTLREETLRRRKATLGPDHPHTLMTMHDLADSLIRAHRGSEAIPIIDDCIRLSAGKPVDRRVVPGVIVLRLRHFREARDAEGCRETARLWERLARTDAEGLYTAACMWAVTAAVLGQAPPTEANPPAEADADRAMEWLRKAVAAGFRHRGRIDENKDLDVLRTRNDFGELIDTLPKPRSVARTPKPS